MSRPPNELEVLEPASALPIPLEAAETISRRLEGAYAPNTRRAWAASWKLWTTYCTQLRVPTLPAPLTRVEAFVEWRKHQHLARQSALAAGKPSVRKPTELKRAAIDRDLAVIAKAHELSCLANPFRTPEGKLAVRAIRMQLSARVEPKPGIGLDAIAATLETLDALAASPDVTLFGRLSTLRDAALIALAYDALLRRSELVALCVGDLERQPTGEWLLQIRRSKTDRMGAGVEVWVAQDTARRVHVWLDAAGLAQAGPDTLIFRSLPHRNRKKGALGDSLAPLLDNEVARIFKRITGNPNVGGHSPRIGATEDLITAGESTAAIMINGRWKTATMVARYGRKHDALNGAMSKMRSRAATKRRTG